MRAKFSIISFFILFSSNLFATHQVRDLIIIQEDTFELNTFPLEDYFEHHAERPASFTMESTACYRGYQATWTVIGNSLYLIGLTSCHENKENKKTIYPISYYLKDKVDENGKVKADWFSGVLNITMNHSYFTKPNCYLIREIIIENGKEINFAEYIEPVEFAKNSWYKIVGGKSFTIEIPHDLGFCYPISGELNDSICFIDKKELMKIFMTRIEISDFNSNSFESLLTGIKSNDKYGELQFEKVQSKKSSYYVVGKKKGIELLIMLVESNDKYLLIECELKSSNIGKRDELIDIFIKTLNINS